MKPENASSSYTNIKEGADMETGDSISYKSVAVTSGQRLKSSPSLDSDRVTWVRLTEPHFSHQRKGRSLYSLVVTQSRRMYKLMNV